MTRMKLTAAYMNVPGGYVAFIEELPGANTEGATLDEAEKISMKRSRSCWTRIAPWRKSPWKAPL
jgi:hypothetical protein